MSAAGYLLSPPQRRLWRLCRRHGEEAFVCSASLRVDEPDTTRVIAAWEQLARRHEVLRTVYRRSPELELPLQTVVAAASPAVELRDLRGLGAAERCAELESFEAELRRRPFDLESGPLLRLGLARLSAEETALWVGLPALSMDAAGLGALLAELAGTLAGRPPAEGALRYVDVAQWLEESLRGEETEAARGHWRERSPAVDPRAPWPGRLRAGDESPFRPRRRRFDLASEPAAALEERAQALDAGLRELLLAAWAALLARRTGRRSAVVGVVVDGRPYEELEGLPGLLARCLPISLEAPGSTPFPDLVRRAAKASEAAEEWQEGFDWEALGGGGDEAGVWAPFAFEQPEVPAFADARPRLALADLDACCEPFLLKLRVLPLAGGLRLELQHDPRAVADADAAALEEQLRELLAEVAREPGRMLGELGPAAAPPAPAAGGPPPPAETIHGWILEQARHSPDAIAAVFEEEALSYGELAARARRLAGHLAALGVAPGEVVPLHLERSLEVLVALLAVLEAGAAYAPLDPAWPARRLESLITALGSPLVLERSGRAAALGGSGLRRVAVDRPESWVVPGVAPPSPALGARPAAGASAAYVLFTSGSTGRPKGVVVEHRQLVAYVAAVRERLAMPEPAAWALVSTFAADLGHTALFPALVGGGCLHVVAQERLTAPGRLGELFVRRRIEALKVVPSHLAALIDGAGASVLPRRRLVLGGEAADWRLVERVRELAPACRVLNHYGPTETTVGVLAGELAGPPPVRERPPLGRPLGGARVAVADRRLRRLGAGLPGELVVGGTALARGYLRRPAATAERFVPDPFGGAPGGRLYRTGDLALELPEGGFLFLGRVDHQVKLRGFRIELGEVEAALGRHPEVAEAAVVVAAAGEELVAYAAPAAGAELGGDALRAFLAGELPDYMVPSKVVVLERLPRTANGKLDRTGLPDPETAADEAAPPVAPEGPIEELLAELWGELLGRSEVGARDSFFDLGGHSLLAMRVVSRVRDAFGVELPLAELFDEPTVRGLARRLGVAIGAEASSGGAPPAPAWERLPRGGELPLSFAQERLWLVAQLEGGSSFYNVPRAVALPAAVDPGLLGRAFSEVARRHEVLRAAFPEVGGRARQVVAPPRPADLPVVDLRALDAEAQEAITGRLAAAEARRPFDLSRGGLLRFALLRRAADSVLLLTLHHMVADAWSMGLLVEEVGALYRAFAAGRASPLAELPFQYADFAAWQRRWLRGEALESRLGYWRRRLAGAPAELCLPFDRPRPARRSSWGASLPIRLPEALGEELRALARRSGATLFMILAAAFKALLRHLSGQDDVVVGTNVANRDRSEVEGLIGLFINQLVLRTDLSGDPSFEELLGRVRATALEAYAHQDLPFEKLVEELRPEREGSRPLLFQVKVELQARAGGGASGAGGTGAAARGTAAGGLRPLLLTQAPVRYDLHLAMIDDRRSLAGFLHYDDQLFDAATVAGFAAGLEEILAAAAERPGARLSELGARLAKSVSQSRRAGLRGKLRSARRQAVSG